MARNKLSDLNDHLFAQLERLNDEEITPEALELECKKSQAITNVAAQISKVASLTIQAVKLISAGILTKESEGTVKTKLLG